jgi:putative ABC transport system permease protein
VSAWLSALRIARREARRARGRTALVVALIMVPIMGLAFAAVLYDSFTLTKAEQVRREIGAADARVIWAYDGAIEQGPEEFYYPTDGSDAKPHTSTAEEVTAALPAGSRVVSDRAGRLSVRTRTGTATVNFRDLPYTDPIASGILRPVSGRAPAAAGEVSITPTAADRTGLGIGGSITAADGTRSWRVVGLVEDPGDLDALLVVFHPGAGPPGGEPRDQRWLASMPHPPTFRELPAYNRRGIGVATRQFMLDPPPPLTVPGSQEPDTLALGTLLGALLMLEVVLLAGPAFAVGVRRRRRELALVAAVGASPGQLRRIVLADGVVLGAVAAVLGLTVGVLTAVLGRGWLETHLIGVRAGGTRVFPQALVAVATVAVLSGLAAALVPARLAARQSVVAGLSGRYATGRLRRRWAVLGLVGLGAGLALAVLGASRYDNRLTISGALLGELGFVFCTPALVALTARLGRVLPLAPRIALRDIGRNRASAAPAICAVLAAVALTTITGTLNAGEDARYARQRLTVPAGYTVAVQQRTIPTSGDQAAMAAVLRDSLPVDDVVTVQRPTCAAAAQTEPGCAVSLLTPPERRCPYEPAWASRQLTTAQMRAAGRDKRCDDVGYGGLDANEIGPSALAVIVVEPADLGRLWRLDPSIRDRAAQLLRSGGVLTPVGNRVVDGNVTVGVQEPAGARQATVPALVVPGAPDFPTLVLGPAAVVRLGLRAEPLGVVAVARRLPTEEEQDRLMNAAGKVPGDWLIDTARRPQPTSPLVMVIVTLVAGVITLGAAAIATGLAVADSRADLATLGAVGASPMVRRLLTLSQTGLIAGLGSALGVLAGLTTSAALLYGTNLALTGQWPHDPPTPFVVPWRTVLAVLVVVPLIGTLGAGLLTRSRLPIERRL